MSHLEVPGAFGLSVISGKTGWLVNKGQAIVERQDFQFTHAFLVLDRGEVIEAEPGGAQIVSIDKYLNRPDVLFCDNPVLLARPGDWFSQLALRGRIVDYARELEGVPYSYLDYVAIGLDRFGIRPKLIRDRVSRHDRLICSELVDFVYQMAGIHLFDDGRDPSNVTPGDLERWVRDHG